MAAGRNASGVELGQRPEAGKEGLVAADVVERLGQQAPGLSCSRYQRFHEQKLSNTCAVIAGRRAHRVTMPLSACWVQESSPVDCEDTVLHHTLLPSVTSTSHLCSHTTTMRRSHLR